MENKSLYYQTNGKFKNPEGTPESSGKIKWSWSTFNKEKKKIRYDHTRKPCIK